MKMAAESRGSQELGLPSTRPLKGNGRLGPHRYFDLPSPWFTTPSCFSRSAHRSIKWLRNSITSSSDRVAGRPDSAERLGTGQPGAAIPPAKTPISNGLKTGCGPATFGVVPASAAPERATGQRPSYRKASRRRRPCRRYSCDPPYPTRGYRWTNFGGRP